jgi:hypothetical protein
MKSDINVKLMEFFKGHCFKFVLVFIVILMYYLMSYVIILYIQQ